MVYLECPADFKSKVRVAGCYVNVGDRFLLLRRHPEKIEGNTWGAPGGKCDPGETMIAAAVRELREETGIALGESDLVQQFHFHVQLSYGNFEYVVFSVVLSECPDVCLSVAEHTEARWVTPCRGIGLATHGGRGRSHTTVLWSARGIFK